MPTIDYIDIGGVLSSEYLCGTIEAIQSADDTCTVNVDGLSQFAPIFYH
jgi:hypothetical protein